MPLIERVKQREVSDKRRVQMPQLIEFADSLRQTGVSVGREVYSGIRLSVDGETIDLYMPERSTDHLGMDALLKMATGKVAGPGDATMMLFSGLGVIDQEVIIDSDTIVDDGVFVTFKDFTSSLESLKVSAGALLGEWQSGDRAALTNYTRQVISRNIFSSSKDMIDDVKSRTETIVDICFKVIEDSKQYPKVKALMDSGRLASNVAVFITSIVSDYFDRLTPGYLGGVKHSSVTSVINEMHQKSKEDVASRLSQSILSSIDSGEEATSAAVADMVGYQFSVLLKDLEAEIEKAVQSFAESADSIADVVIRVIDAYIGAFNEFYGRASKGVPKTISGTILMAGEEVGLKESSDIISNLTVAAEAMGAISDAVESAGRFISEQYIRAVWDAMISSVEPAPVRIQRIVKDEPIPHPSLIHQMEEGLTDPAAHENFREFMRAACATLTERRLYAEASGLLKCVAQSNSDPDISEVIAKIENLALAMGSLDTKLDPGRSGPDAHPFYDVSFVVMGELSDKFKTSGIDKIAVPINKHLPTMTSHLKMLKSIDSVVMSYTMDKDVHNIVNNAVMSVYTKKPVGIMTGRDKAFVVKKFNNLSDIRAFLEEQALQMFGVSMHGSAADSNSVVSKMLFSDAKLREKFAMFEAIVSRYNIGVIQAINFGSTEDIIKKIPDDFNSLGIKEDSKMSMFLAACKLYRAANLYADLNERIPTSEHKREAAYYAAGQKISSLIKDGKLDQYSNIVMASVRSNDFKQCPFGLSIPDGCKTVGDHIDGMQSINTRDSEAIVDDKTKANRLALERIQRQNSQCGKCKYLRSLMKSKSGMQSVVCNFGEANAGVDAPDFSTGVGAAYPTSFWAGLFTIPSALGPEARDSWFARSPGATPFGQTMINTPGI